MSITVNNKARETEWQIPEMEQLDKLMRGESLTAAEHKAIHPDQDMLVFTLTNVLIDIEGWNLSHEDDESRQYRATYKVDRHGGVEILRIERNDEPNSKSPVWRHDRLSVTDTLRLGELIHKGIRIDQREAMEAGEEH